MPKVTDFISIDLLKKNNSILDTVVPHLNESINGAATKKIVWQKIFFEIKRASTYSGITGISNISNINLKIIAWHLVLQPLIGLPFHIPDAINTALDKLYIFDKKIDYNVQEYRNQTLEPNNFYCTRTAQGIIFRFLDSKNNLVLRTITNEKFQTNFDLSLQDTKIEDISHELVAISNFSDDLKSNIIIKTYNENSFIFEYSSTLFDGKTGQECANYSISFEVSENGLKIVGFILNINKNTKSTQKLLEIADNTSLEDTKNLISPDFLELNFLTVTQNPNKKAKKINPASSENTDSIELFTSEKLNELEHTLDTNRNRFLSFFSDTELTDDEKVEFNVDEVSEDFSKAYLESLYQASEIPSYENSAPYQATKKQPITSHPQGKTKKYYSSTFSITLTFIGAGLTIGMVIGAGLFLSGLLAPLGLVIIAGTVGSATALAGSTAVGGILLGAIFGAVGYLAARIIDIEKRKDITKVEKSSSVANSYNHMVTTFGEKITPSSSNQLLKNNRSNYPSPLSSNPVNNNTSPVLPLDSIKNK